MLSTEITLLYEINVGSDLLSLSGTTDILYSNISLFTLGCNNLDMLCKVYLCLQIISCGSVNGLLPCLLYCLDSSQGFAIESAFNQRKGNILSIIQQPDFRYILWIVGNGYFAPRQIAFSKIIVLVP